MDVNYAYVVFLLAGVIFGTFVWIPKFVLLSLVSTVAYFVFCIPLSVSVTAAFASAICGFVFVQIGYVGGVAFKLFFNKIFRGGSAGLDFPGNRKEHADVEARPRNH